MRKNIQLVVVSCAVLALSGCTMPWHSKASATPPPQAQAPTAPHADTPPPTAEAKPTPAPVEPTPAEAAPPPPPPDTKPATTVHHRKTKPSPATPATPDNASSTTTAPGQTASATPPAGTPAAPTESAIGQLSAGDESSSGATKSEAVDLISTTERRLKAITRPLTPAEQQTAEKVRTFLEQARQALHSQDIAAAHTLAIKANLLLDELQK
jgi:hypothetical protein